MAILTKAAPGAAEASGVGGKKHAIRGRAPTKQNINLATVGMKRTRWWLVILALILIFAAAAAIGKFLVYDRLMEVSAAQSEAENVHIQLMDTYRRIESYGDLNDTFAHYTYSGFTAEELGRVDRVAVADILQRVVLTSGDVSRWELKGNVLTLTLEGNTLQSINLMAQRLLQEDIVSYCEVNTATTNSRTRLIEELGGERVSANIVAYLMKPEEVTEK